MPLGLGSGFWAAILPVQTTNLATNPSLEYGTAGWSALAGGASIGSTSYRQAFGAWSLQVNHTTTSEGAFLSVGTPAPGSYSMSAFVNGTSGHRYRLVAESAGGAPLGAGSITSAGGWQSIVTRFGLAAGTGLNIVARHIDSADGTFYLDGVQLESGTFPTTYIDGDQEGCQWLGAPHQSQSVRSGQSRAGGSVVALADLGFAVDKMTGIGMPPIQNTSQSYALTPGAQFQRSRPAERAFTLTSYLNGPGGGTALAGLHTARRTFIDAIKPDLVTPQQPIRFLYVGGQGTVQIDAVYDGGMDFGNLDGFVEDDAPVRFVAYDPFWYSPIQEGTALAPRTNIGSVRFLAYRDTLGKWGTLGSDGTTVNGASAGVFSLASNPAGTLFVGGNFSTVGQGTVGRFICQYVGAAFGTLTQQGGTLNGIVQTIAPTPSGTTFIGGLFTLANGTAARFTAQYVNGAWGTLIGGTVASNVAVIVPNITGGLYVGGDFLTVAGTTAVGIAVHNADAWGTLTGGQLNASVLSIVQAPTGTIFVGGLFTAAGGTTVDLMAYWAGAWGSFGTSYGLTSVDSLALGPNQIIYFGGQGSTLIRQNNRVFTSAMGSGLIGDPSTGIVNAILPDLSGGLYAAGDIDSTGARVLSDSLTYWNGYVWLQTDVDLPNNNPVQALTRTASGTLFVGGNFSGTATAASIGTIVNTGRSEAWPVVRFRNLSAGTVHPFTLANPTVGACIYFDLALVPGEIATLTLAPGARSFTSNLRANLFGQILPGSNLSSFRLLPGTNYVSFFSDNDSLEVSTYWTPIQWSADG